MAQSTFGQAGEFPGVTLGADARSLAIAHGAPFPEMTGLPDCLVVALQQAAQTNQGILHLDAHGTETFQSYQDLWADACRVAAGLRQCAPDAVGRPVILQMQRNSNLLTGFWGCVLAGFVPLPIAAHSTEPDAARQAAMQLLAHPIFISDRPNISSPANHGHQGAATDTTLTQTSAISAVLGFALDNLKQSDPMVPSPDVIPQANDLALLLLTSGSTGTPKAVMLTHGNLQASVYGMATVNGLSSESVTLNWMPLEHVASLVMFHLTPVFLGCSQIQAVNEWVLKKPLRWLELCDRHRVTATWAPNFAYGLINDTLVASQASPNWDLSCLCWMGNGAEAVVGGTTRQFLRLLEPFGLGKTVVSPGYGMSETCSGIVHSHDFSLATTSDDDTFVSVGQPIPGISLRIVDDSTQVVLEGVEGQLQVRGLTVMAGYYQRPDLNADVFTADGWFSTGDLAMLKNGSLTITGRQKDVIILNGVNYYSHDIETVVNSVEGVEGAFTAAFAGRREGDRSDQVAIAFHPSGGIPENLDGPSHNAAQSAGLLNLIRQIRQQVMQSLGIVPTYIIPLDRNAIPKTTIGKIQRRQLSQHFTTGKFDAILQQLDQRRQQQQPIPSGTTPRNAIQQKIAAIWQSVLGLDSVGIYENFFERGGNSIRLMQVLSQLQIEIEPSLDAIALFQHPTIATLTTHLTHHRSSTPPASQLPAPASLPPPFPQTPTIAVIGMAGRFPGAKNLDEFWHNLCNGIESIAHFTDAELLESGIDPALINHPNYVKASPTLDDVEYFDAEFFGYSPKEAELMDPQQRLLLECAWASLEDAGYDSLTYDGAIALYAGASMNTYLLNHVWPHRDRLDPNDSLDVFTLSSLGGFQATVANDKDYLTTRVSYKLNLRGPSVNVQTACSTSLVAIHLAAQSLIQGDCDMALAGGVSVETPQKAGHLYQDGMILTPDGHCRAFDAQAQGTLFGSGVGLVVLKRLDEAIAHRDHIYAVIKGSAIGNDGSQKVGYLAPRSEGQTTVATQAMAIAQVSPETIGYVEAHGTGTRLGDPIEITGLTQAFRLSATQSVLPMQSCPIGSVKTNVGHLNIASGVVGFIKTVLALHHRQIPASLHFEQPNPQIDFGNSPFYVNTELQDWPDGDTPRRACVNSLGIGGTNAHVVVEEGGRKEERGGKKEERGGSQRGEGGSQKEKSGQRGVFVVSARDEGALRQLVGRYERFLQQRSDVGLVDLCFTAAVGRSHFSHRVAWLVDSVDDLQSQLQTGLANLPQEPTATPSNIAFLFTGQGGQCPGMGHELYTTQPIFQHAIDHCANLLQSHDISLLDVLYPDLVESKVQNLKSKIHQTAYTQPVLFAVEYAIAQLWRSWGIQPSVLTGHSIGEYVAACVAGVFSVEDALKLVAIRGQLMQALPTNGTMVTVEASADQIASIMTTDGSMDGSMDGSISIAAFNSPNHTVLSGTVEAIAQITTHLEQHAIRHKPLQVSHAFHSPLMQPIVENFRQVAASITYHPPQIPIVSTLTGELVGDRIATPDHWVDHICQPVKFFQATQTLQQQSYRTFIECGPRPILITLAQTTFNHTRSHFSTHPPTWLPSLHPQKADSQQILTTLASLYQQGHDIHWNAVYHHTSAHRIPLPTYPFQRQRHWLDRPITPGFGKNEERRTKDEGRLNVPTLQHPLLGSSISTPLNHSLFQQTISTETLKSLTDHQVHHQVIFPGAAYLEMAIAAGQSVLKTDGVRLKQLVIGRSIALTNQPYTLQTILTPVEQSAHEYHLQIYSHDTQSQDPDWILHCEGIVGTGNLSHAAKLDIRQIQQTCLQTITADEHYRHCQQRGLHYSGAFRSVQTIWRIEEGKALGHIRCPGDSAAAQSTIHPALLDACFQVILAAIPNGMAYVPISLDALTVYGSLPSDESLWSLVELQSVTTPDPELVTANVRILDTEGHPLILVTGLSAKQMQSNAIASMTPPSALAMTWQDWLYQIQWRPIPLANTHLSRFSQSGAWLLVGENGEWMKAIASRLQTQQQACTKILLDSQVSHSLDTVKVNSIDPDFDSVFSQIPAEKALKGILYLVDHHAFKITEKADCYTVMTQVKQTCHPALKLVQALINWEQSVPLWLITQGVQAVSANDSVNLTPAPLWGLGKAIALEHPELAPVCLDLDPSANQNQSIEQIVHEIANAGDRPKQIAYRHGTRYEARLVAAILDSRLSSEPEDLAVGDLNANLQLQISQRGSLEHLTWQSGSRRQPTTGEVEVQVQATGLNFRDVLNALGLYPGEAGALGLECVGTVVAIAPDVTTVQVGDEVMAIAPASFSQFVTVSAELVAPKPSHLSPKEAATIPVTFLTAYYALCELGKLQKGDRVLIHAAAGGVGQAAVQLAQQVGADIFATASPPKWERLQQQSIQHIFNSRTLDFAAEILERTNGEGVNLVLNSLNGDAIASSLSTLALNGRFLEIGKAGIWPPAQLAQTRPDVDYHIIDLVAITQNNPTLIHTMLTYLTHQFQAQALHPLPVCAFTADRSIAAFRWMQQGKHVGKIVIIPKAEGGRRKAEGRRQEAEPRTQQFFPHTHTPTHPHTHTPTHLHPTATYLITGGTGALGLQLAQWLANQGARHLLLLGRNDLSAEAQVVIDRLAIANVTVQTIQADVADYAQLEGAIAPYVTATPPLKGVFHLAGQLDDGVIQRQTWSRFETVMAAKVEGTWNLHQLTRQLELEHFVMFSSAASLIGSAGQSNYAAANAFLDAIAHYRHHAGLPALTINWGAWSGSGLAASVTVSQRLQRTGMASISAALGFEILDHAMTTEVVQLGVLPGQFWKYPDQPLFAGLPDTEAPDTELPNTELADNQFSSATTRDQKVSSGIVGRLRQLAAVSDLGDRTHAQKMLLLDFLRQEVAIVLGIDAQQLTDLQVGLTDLGLDSLTIVELRNRLQASLDRPLSVTLLYDYPTLNALANYLIALLFSTKDDTSNNTNTNNTNTDLSKVKEGTTRLQPEQGDRSLHFSLNDTSNSIQDLSDEAAEALLLKELERLDY